MYYDMNVLCAHIVYNNIKARILFLYTTRKRMIMENIGNFRPFHAINNMKIWTCHNKNYFSQVDKTFFITLKY